MEFVGLERMVEGRREDEGRKKRERRKWFERDKTTKTFS